MPKVFKWDEINGRGTEQDRVEAFLTDTTDTYAILQLRDIPETRDEHFMSYNALRRKQLEPEVDHYEVRFNILRPADFHGHSLSVSDIVALRQSGIVSAHYVDSVGFQDLPGFFSGKNHLRTLEDMVEQNDNQLDGIINNLPDEKLPCKCEVKKESVLDQLKELRASDPAPPKDLAEQILERIRE